MFVCSWREVFVCAYRQVFVAAAAAAAASRINFSKTVKNEERIYNKPKKEDF
ncbi:hypothetical protein [Methanimicrococcus hongohii]|uniref:hypothetical protein n=1 Tax=Methanimicrococcus hongohii TaxID=3028295 RepID=UPI002931391B|nr:hypothetical protein [Methanimicrococcus sp. Hf6]